MKYGKKIYIIILIILFLFFLVMFFFLGVPNIKEESLSSTIILGDTNTVWKYQNKEWKNITDITTIENMSWKKYSIFDNNKYIGNYLLWHDNDRWFVFDDDKKAISIDGSLLGLLSNYDLKVGHFSENKVNDMTYVNRVLSDNNLSTSSQFTSLYKVSFDFDSDSENEEFYIMSNVFPLDFNPSKLFSIAFMEKNGQIYYLYNDIIPNSSMSGCKPFYSNFLDTNNDNVYEIILSCGRYSDMGRIDMLYGFSENNFEMLVSNE